MTTSSENYTPESYSDLSRQYIRQAGEELAREDYCQAGEKAWGAVSTAIKSIAQQRGWNHRHHRLTGDALRELADEFANDSDSNQLKQWFNTVELMHENFYENTWTEAEVADGVHRAQGLLEFLDALRHQSPRPMPNRSNNQKRRWSALNGVAWDDSHPPE
jgi:uncharacterized protein (UPF0332 family)